MTDLIYAGVGARRSPSHILESMTKLAYQMSQNGWHLRSGFADGADKAFGLGAAQHSDETGDSSNWTMYLPWSGFNNAPKDDPCFQTLLSAKPLVEIAEACHPAWDVLTNADRLLMLRNVAVVAGPMLDKPVTCVIGWTPDAKGSGGTGHTFRVAKLLKIPVFDLASDYDQRAVLEFINGCK